MSAQENKEALGFVTKKGLVSFANQIAFMVNGNCVFSMAAVCEWDDAESEQVERYRSSPKIFRVVSLPNGPKLDQSLVLHMNDIGFGGVVAILELP